MTKKGLALGAASALVVAGFSGLPANAAGLADTSFVSLAPSAGAEYTVLTGANKEFSLRSNEASSVSGTGRNVSFLVEDADSAIEPKLSGSTQYSSATVSDWSQTGTTVTLTVTNTLKIGDVVEVTGLQIATGTGSGVGAATTDTVANGKFTVATANSTTVTFAATTRTVVATGDTTSGQISSVNSQGALELHRSVRASNGSYVVNTGIDTANTDETLILVTGSSETATRSVTVTAWVDANGNRLIDSTEYVSPTRTVTFIAAASVTAVTSADPYVVGLNTSTAKAYATTTPALNGNYMDTGDLKIRFTHQGNSNDFDVNAAFDTTARTWSANSSANITIAAGAHTATAMIGSAAISPVLSINVVAATAADGSTAITQDANNKVVVANNGNATSTVRAKTLAVSATMSFFDVDKAAVSSGRLVQVTVTTITGATGVKVNGTAVTQGQVLNVQTDAAGKVVANVTATTANDTAAIVLTGVAEGVSGTSTTATFNFADAVYTLSDLNGTASLDRSMAIGGSYTFNFAAYDQWATLLSGDYRLKVAVSGNTVSETYPSLSTGTASVTVADSQIVAGNPITVVVTPQKLVNGTWGTSGAPAAVTYGLRTIAQSGAAVTAVSADASIPSSVATLVAGDSRTTQAAVSVAGSAGADSIQITGTVTNSVTGAARPGAAVTVTAPANILLVNGSKAAYGSLSFFADATTGNYSVSALSNMAQIDSVVTVASQGGSKTIKVTFEAALATSGATLTLDAPSSVAPGSTMVVTAKLTDKFGNPVRNNNGATLEANNAVNVTYAGPGLIVGNISNLTDLAGEVTFRVLLGTNDTGSAIVTAVFQKNTSVTTDDISVSKTIVIGAAVSADLSAWTSLKPDNQVKVYAKNVIGAGKVQIKVNGKEIAWTRAMSVTNIDGASLRNAGGAYYLVRTVTLSKGSKTAIEVFVDGKRVSRTAYTGK